MRLCKNLLFLSALAWAGERDWAELLASGNRAQRLHVIDQLARQPGETAVALLLGALVMDDEVVREHAARALGRCGVDGRRGLIEALHDPRPPVRLTAARALSAAPHLTVPVHAALFALSDDPDPVVRTAVLAAMPHFPFTQDLDPSALLDAIAAMSNLDRVAACGSELARKLDPARLLVHENRRVRLAAVHALGCLDTSQRVALTRALTDDTDIVRLAAAEVLLRREGVQAFEILFAATLREQDPNIESRLVNLLASLGEVVAPRITRHLRGAEPRARETCLMVLKALGPHADPALHILIPDLAAKGAEQKLARDALRAVGDAAIPALLLALQDAPPALSRTVVSELGRHGNRIVPHVRPLLEKADPYVRVALIRLVAPHVGVEDLIAWFGDDSAQVRLCAVGIFGSRTNDVDRVVPALIVALADESAPVRRQAVTALGAFRAQAEQIVAAVSALENDPDLGTRRMVVTCLGRMGHDHPLARAVIEHAIEDPGLSSQALDAYRAWGDKGTEALVRALRKGNDNLKVRAARALRKRPQALPPLMEVLGGSVNRSVRREILRTIATFGAKAAPAALQLVKLLKDSRIRSYVRRALSAIGPDAIPHLVDAASGSQPYEIKRVVGGMGTRAVESLMSLLADPDAGRRRSVAWLLGSLGPKSAPAVPALTAMLVDKDRFVVGQAAWALGRIGPAAKTALPALRELLVNEPDLRSTLRDALIRIDP